MNKKMRFVGVLMISTTLVTGCVTTGGTQKYANKNDVCYAQRQPLLAVENEFSKSLIAGAVVGAIVGGIIGGLVSKDKGKGIAIGAAAGGLSGLAAGYLKAKHDKNLSQQQIIAEIDGDTRKDISQLNSATGTVKRLTDCRFQQLAAIRAGVKSGTIKKAEASSKLKEVKRLMAEDQELINAILERSDKRLTAYAEADAKTQNVQKEAMMGQAGSIQWYTPGQNNNSPSAEVTTYYSSGNVNVRSGPSTSNKVVGALKTNDKVEVLGTAEAASNWKKIRFNNSTAYVYSPLLKETKTQAAPTVNVENRGLVDPKMVQPVETTNVHQQAAVANSTVKEVSNARYQQLEAELNEIALLSGTDQISKTPFLKVANG